MEKNVGPVPDCGLDRGGLCAVSYTHLDVYKRQDEAHCVSQWGQDFRPSYLKIPEFLEQLPVRPVMGCLLYTSLLLHSGGSLQNFPGQTDGHRVFALGQGLCRCPDARQRLPAGEIPGGCANVPFHGPQGAFCPGQGIVHLSLIHI